MQKVFIVNGVYYESQTEAGTEERAEEVIKAMEPILASQKKFWAERIRALFNEYVNEGTEAKILVHRRRDGLYWNFHKHLLKGMCEAFDS